MAASTLARPGTEYGPCDVPCEHTDCAESRRMANTACALCEEPIGYDRFFYEDRERGLVHALCLEEEVARGR